MLEDGWCFFGICPRISVGQAKKNCAPELDILWCEIDAAESLSADSALELAVSRLESADLGVFPSAIAFSGNRSPHLFFKLDQALPQKDIETLNRGLAKRLRGDKSVFNIDRCIRHPGSIHEKSGVHAEILDFSGHITPVADLAPIRPKNEPKPVVRRAPTPASLRSDDWLAAAEAVGNWRERDGLDLIGELTNGNHLAYIEAMPRRGWSDNTYPSRSEAEQAIVCTLVRRGASDNQIGEFANQYLGKHIEKVGQGDGSYLVRMIDGARARLFENGYLSHPHGGSRRKREAEHRWTSTEQYQAALDLVEGQLVNEWIRQIQVSGIAKERTAYRIRDRLLGEQLVVIDPHEHVWCVADGSIGCPQDGTSTPECDTLVTH